MRDASKYWPRQFEELAGDPIPASLINEPSPPDNVSGLGSGHAASAARCDLSGVDQYAGAVDAIGAWSARE
jgi:hypothetical protein